MVTSRTDTVRTTVGRGPTAARALPILDAEQAGSPGKSRAHADEGTLGTRRPRAVLDAVDRVLQLPFAVLGEETPRRFAVTFEQWSAPAVGETDLHDADVLGKRAGPAFGGDQSGDGDLGPGTGTVGPVGGKAQFSDSAVRGDQLTTPGADLVAGGAAPIGTAEVDAV